MIRTRETLEEYSNKAASICRPLQGIFRVSKLGVSLVIPVKGPPPPWHGVRLVPSSRVLPNEISRTSGRVQTQFFTHRIISKQQWFFIADAELWGSVLCNHRELIPVARMADLISLP